MEVEGVSEAKRDSIRRGEQGKTHPSSRRQHGEHHRESGRRRAAEEDCKQDVVAEVDGIEEEAERPVGEVQVGAKAELRVEEVVQAVDPGSIEADAHRVVRRGKRGHGQISDGDGGHGPANRLPQGEGSAHRSQSATRLVNTRVPYTRI